MDAHFVFNALSIVLIDLILGGDNAVVIALAVRSLPRSQRRGVIAAGSFCAVALRVAATFFVAELLHTRFVQLIGGLFILWIAVRLFSDASKELKEGRDPKSFWRAMSYIVVADITMSTDNVLAVAAASHGSIALLIFGLGLSIPFVVFASSFLSRLMDKYPPIVYAGAAILGKVGAEMILTDAFTTSLWQPPAIVRWAIELACAVGVVAAGRLMDKRRLARA